MAMRHAPGYLAARGFASLSPSCFGDDRSSGRSGEFEFAAVGLEAGVLAALNAISDGAGRQ
jgi:hypothetical protein